MQYSQICDTISEKKVELASLHEASRTGNVDRVVAHLGNSSCDVNRRNKTGATPLMMAVQQGHLAVVQLLVNHQADVGIVSEAGDSALMLAVKGYRADILKVLLERGAEVVNGVVPGGPSPLRVALDTGSGSEAIVDLLVQNDAASMVEVLFSFNSLVVHSYICGISS